MDNPTRSNSFRKEDDAVPESKRRKINPSRKTAYDASNNVMPPRKRGIMNDQRTVANFLIYEDETSDTRIEQQKMLLRDNLRRIVRRAETDYLLQVSEWALNLTRQKQGNGSISELENIWTAWLIKFKREVEMKMAAKDENNSQLLCNEHEPELLKEFGAALQKLIIEAKRSSGYQHTFGHCTESAEIICGHLIFKGMGLDAERSSDYFQERTNLWEQITRWHLNIQPISKIRPGRTGAEIYWYACIEEKTTSESIQMDVGRMWLFIDRIKLQQVLDAR